MKLLRPRALTVFPTKESMSAHLNGLMQSEAALVLAEGVAASADDISLAMMLGAGYPPFQELFPASTSAAAGPVDHDPYLQH